MGTVYPKSRRYSQREIDLVLKQGKNLDEIDLEDNGIDEVDQILEESIIEIERSGTRGFKSIEDIKEEQNMSVDRMHAKAKKGQIKLQQLSDLQIDEEEENDITPTELKIHARS